MKLLIAYATKTGTTKACVEMMAEHFAYHDVTLFDLANGTPQIADFDAIIIGGPIRMNKMDARVKKFVEDNRTVLRDKLYALFLCCGFNENAEFYFSKNFVYFFKATREKATPIIKMAIQETTVHVQPNASEIKAIPYIEIAAPT